MNKTNKMIYIFLTVLFLYHAPCYAEPEAGVPQDNKALSRIIVPTGAVPFDELDTIFLGEDFGKTKQKWRIKLKQDPDKPKEEKPFGAEAGWVKIWNLIAAHIVRALTLLLITAALIFIIIFYRRINFPRLSRKKIKPEIRGKEREESSAALLEEAELYYRRGNLREAWSAVYRAALAAFRKNNIAHPRNATEYECLSLVTQKAPGYAEQFKQLVHNRITVAYRSIIPAETEFTTALMFCRTLDSDTGEKKDGR
jgi:hypothetical protein